MGKLWFVAGEVYEGEWHKNEMHGHGKRATPTKLRPRRKPVPNCNPHSESLANTPPCAGTMTYPTGAVYKGEFRHDVRHGLGKLTYPNGDMYDGNWMDDNKQGRGIFRWASGAAYTGEFSEGVMDGDGSYEFTDGSVFEGQYRDGRRHGRGTFKDATGAIHEGIWKHGEEQPFGSKLPKDVVKRPKRTANSKGHRVSIAPGGQADDGASSTRSRGSSMSSASFGGGSSMSSTSVGITSTGGVAPPAAAPSAQAAHGTRLRSSRTPSTKIDGTARAADGTERVATNIALSEVTPEGPSLATIRAALAVAAGNHYPLTSI